MIKTEYDIGQIINLPWKVGSITKTEDSTKYSLWMPEKDGIPLIVMDEEEITDVECISADKYEAEINDLKDEISRLREMYQLEHSNKAIAGDSHHPQENTYADEWRKLP